MQDPFTVEKKMDKLSGKGIYLKLLKETQISIFYHTEYGKAECPASELWSETEMTTFTTFYSI